MLRTIIAAAVIVAGAAVASSATAASPASAIVIQDQVALRAAPRDSAQQQAVLWQGEVVEIRGERMDYVQIYDPQRERGGFVRASQVRRTTLSAAEAPELLSVVRFVRDTPGAEALGIGLVAAYIQAAPAEVINGDAGIEALDALGTLADRLAWRASSGLTLGKGAQTALAAHLEVAGRYGVKFMNYERDGRMQICYDGDAFRRVLAMRSKPEQRARAALALTRAECVNPDVSLLERRRMDEWRAGVLERVDASALPGYLKNRVLMRRASVWSSLAYQRARIGGAAEAAANGGEAAETAGAAANRALSEMVGIIKIELTDDDSVTYSDAAMRVSASRWAALPPAAGSKGRTSIVTAPGQPGETCISLIDAKHGADNPLLKRCTYAIVWPASGTLNREGTALALAVQPTATWRELWVFRKESDGWTIDVIPPAASGPDIGYAEFAGWVPGGTQMLVAREARSEGKYKHNFEVLRLDTLAPLRQASDPGILGAFQRWQDASWKRQTLSIR